MSSQESLDKSSDVSRRRKLTPYAAVIGAAIGLAAATAEQIHRNRVGAIRPNIPTGRAEGSRLEGQAMIEGTDRTLSDLVVKMRVLVKDHTPGAYEDKINYEGEEVSRLVFSQPLYNATRGTDGYLQIVSMLRPGQKIPFSAAIILGAESERFKIGRDFESATYLLRSEPPESPKYFLQDVSIEAGRVIEEPGYELTPELHEGPKLREMAVQYGNFIGTALGVVELAGQEPEPTQTQTVKIA